MRTREIVRSARLKISETRSRQDKQFLIDLIAKLERAETELRKLRLTAQNALSMPAGKAPTSNNLINISAAREAEFTKRMRASLREAEEYDAKKAAALSASPGKPEGAKE
jgi:hypothetical protein